MAFSRHTASGNAMRKIWQHARRRGIIPPGQVGAVSTGFIRRARRDFFRRLARPTISALLDGPACGLSMRKVGGSSVFAWPGRWLTLHELNARRV